ncbi:uncharacterized mitochondrial protein-like protein, partial [Tanacetum coccineum]
KEKIPRVWIILRKIHLDQYDADFSFITIARGGSSFTFTFFNLPARAELVLKAEELLLPLAGAEYSSFNVMTVNVEAQNLSETKLRGILLALKYRVKQGSSFQEKFEISMMGELTYFLGVQIKQDDKGISICQEQYTRNLLKKYEIFDSSSVQTLIVPPNNLGPDLVGKPVNETLYRGMIGSQMYLTVTKPDTQFSTCLCAVY